MKKYILWLNVVLLTLVFFVFVLPIVFLFIGATYFLTLTLFYIGSAVIFLMSLIGIVLESIVTWNARHDLTRILRSPSAIILLFFIALVIYAYVLQS